MFYGTPIIQKLQRSHRRVDHSISSKDKLTGRYFYDYFTNVPSYGGNLLVYRQGSTISSHNAVIQEMHIFSPNLLNNFRIGFARVVSLREPPADAPSVNDFGVPIYQPTPKAIQSITISGYFGTGANPTTKLLRNDFSYIDDVSWTHGRHSFAFGALLEKAQLNMVNQSGLPGTFTFSGDTTGSALADFMLGKMRTFMQANGQHVKNRNGVINFYAQDSFRLGRKLTLNYGVRYDPSEPWHDLYRQNQVFYPEDYAAGVKSTVFPNAPAGLMFSGDAGVPYWGTTGDYKNIAPRVGFAYDALGNGSLSVRGGFGIFYDSRFPAFYNDRVLSAAPYAATVALTTPEGPFSNPYLGVPNPFPATFPPAADAQFVLPVQVYSWVPNQKQITPRNYSWNLAVEQSLPWNFVLRSAYVRFARQLSEHGLGRESCRLYAGKYLEHEPAQVLPELFEHLRDQPVGELLVSVRTVQPAETVVARIHHFGQLYVVEGYRHPTVWVGCFNAGEFWLLHAALQLPQFPGGMTVVRPTSTIGMSSLTPMCGRHRH